jgi:hypothetical protein
MKKSNHKTAKEWQQDLKLETAPDVGLMRLLEQASEDKSLKNPKVKTSKYRFSKTAEMPKVTIQNALLQASLGELLAKAR